MRAVITDAIKKINSLGFLDVVRVTGTAEDTKFEAVDGDKTVILKGKFNAPQADLVGVFGITHLPLLNGLLNFKSYQTDGATFGVKHRDLGGVKVTEEFEFRDDRGQGSNFRLMAGTMVPEQPLVADIKWDVTFQPEKSKIAEFAALAGLYSSFDQFFSVKTKDGNLVLAIGEEGSTSHRASIILQEGIEGELKGELLWPIQQFLSILKVAEGSDYTVSITSKGALAINMTNEYASYQFVLPARRR